MKSSIYLFLTLFICFFSCNKDKTSFRITDFSKSKTVTLKPHKWYPYAMINITVKGYANDTIKIKESYYGDYDILLIGQIDTIKKMEYYGEGEVEFTFDPFRATKGQLDINIKL